jgi:hypothetical protein
LEEAASFFTPTALHLEIESKSHKGRANSLGFETPFPSPLPKLKRRGGAHATNAGYGLKDCATEFTFSRYSTTACQF